MQNFKQKRCFKTENTGVDFGNGLLFRRSIFFFNNACHIAFRIADNAPVTVRVGHNCGKHGGSSAALYMLVIKFTQFAGIQKRSVAAKNHNGSFKIFQFGFGLHYGMSCAELLFLVYAYGLSADKFVYKFCAVAGNNYFFSGTGAVCGVKHSLQHGFAANFMQNLRQFRFHAGAHTGS